MEKEKKDNKDGNFIATAINNAINECLCDFLNEKIKEMRDGIYFINNDKKINK